MRSTRRVAGMLAIALLSAACGSSSGGGDAIPRLSTSPDAGAVATDAPSEADQSEVDATTSEAAESVTPSEDATSATPDATAQPSAEPTAAGSPTATATDTTGTGSVRAAGTYRYDTTGTSQTGGSTSDLPKVTLLVVEEPDGDTQVATRDMRDADGNGGRTTTAVVYAPEGVLLSRVENITVIPGGYVDERSWSTDPPALIAPVDAKPGDHLELQLTDESTTLDIVIDILRVERVTIGGEAVDTVVARTVTTFSGDIEGTQTSTSWTRPSDFLLIREEVHTDVTAGFISSKVDYTAQLQSL